MTSNERKILECIWDHGGKAHIQHVAHKTKLSGSYSLFLCSSLAKAGHLEFVNPSVCQLAEKGYGHFQDHVGIEVVVASSTPQEESTDDPALSGAISDDKDDEFQEDENIGEAHKDQEVRPDPAAQQGDYGAGEKREGDIDKKLKELFPNKDEDEGKTDFNPPAGDGDATQETKENVPGNDTKPDQEGTAKPAVSPIDSIGLMIKMFLGLLKRPIKVLESGNAAQGTRHQ